MTTRNMWWWFCMTALDHIHFLFPHRKSFVGAMTTHRASTFRRSSWMCIRTDLSAAYRWRFSVSQQPVKRTDHLMMMTDWQSGWERERGWVARIFRTKRTVVVVKNKDAMMRLRWEYLSSVLWVSLIMNLEILVAWHLHVLRCSLAARCCAKRIKHVMSL